MTLVNGKAGKSAGVNDACPAAPVEIELKLLVSPGMLSVIRDHAVLRLPVRNKGTVRRLEATYFDTADYSLFSAGLSLRVRRSGRHFTQTVKRISTKDALSRQEWETPVVAMSPDLGALPIAEIGTPFETIAPEALLPVFTTNVRRHAFMVDLADAQVEVAFDEGTVVAGAEQEPISEIELELKRGRPATLYELGLSLMEAGPLRLGTQSKSTRGYMLASLEAPKAVKAGSSKLEREDIVDDAIARFMADCQQQILANLVPAESGEDPEGIHQLRVALRRLRTLLWLLRREIAAPSLEALEADAKHLAQSVGPARNWDVFIGSTLSGIEDAGLHDVEFSGLRSACVPFRDNSYAVVRKMIADPQINRFLLALGLAIEQRSWRNDIGSATLAVLAEPVNKFSVRALARVERRAIKLGRNFDELQPDERHKLRLTLKKLRYALEFFLPLYAERTATTKFLKRLSHLQDVLGMDNDIATSHGILHELKETTVDPDLHRAMGAVIGWQRSHQIAQADRLHEKWEQFTHSPLFWNR